IKIFQKFKRNVNKFQISIPFGNSKFFQTLPTNRIFHTSRFFINSLSFDKNRIEKPEKIIESSIMEKVIYRFKGNPFFPSTHFFKVTFKLYNFQSNRPIQLFAFFRISQSLSSFLVPKIRL